MPGAHDPAGRLFYSPEAASGPQQAARSEITTGKTVGEARWPMAAAVLVAMILTLLVPPHMRPGPQWLPASVEGALLLALIVTDPGKINRRSTALRVLSTLLVAVLVAEAMWGTVTLVYDLVHGGGVTNSASELLEASVVVWVSNNIAFALLYWELDGGGAAARAHHLPAHPDLAFPQQLNPAIAAPGWRPRFIDYLYLGFTNATAFSPTDVMPLVPWAKIAMGVQSLISLCILSLVIARAVNILE